MRLDLVDDVHAALVVHHIDGKASPAKAPCAADPVQVGVVVGHPGHVHREVKVHHEGHLLHVDPCGPQEHIRDIHPRYFAAASAPP